MYFVTNRAIRNGKNLKMLGNKPSGEGPNDLRLCEATKSKNKWNIKLIENEATDAMIAEIAKLEKANGTQSSHNGEKKYSSWYVAKKLYFMLKSKKNKKENLVFFVHGFNNNVEDMLNRAHNFSVKYGVEVIPFSWPANGGGVKGSLSYKSDKRDALASLGALDRCLEKITGYLSEFNQEFLSQLRLDLAQNGARSEADAMKLYDRLVGRGCPFTVNLVCHSMGNYLFKHLLKSGSYHGDRLMFDNVILVAADTNNKEHKSWVDKINCRRRIYVTINEDDKALRLSRVKGGEEQQARLGHFPHYLDSSRAKYIDFTDQAQVKNSHAYFEGDSLKNLKVKKFFKEALNGKRAEVGLYYNPESNMYRFSR